MQTVNDQQYQFSPRLRMIAIALMVVGILGLTYGFFTYTGEESHRVWANLLLNSVFFFSISMASAFFISAHFLAWGGWWMAIRRVPEAIMGFLPFGAVILLLVLIFGQHHLYHWSHEGIMDPKSPEYDPIVAGKQGYLNNPFYFGRFFLFVGVLVTCAILLRKTSIKEDGMPLGDTSMHKRSLVIASVFIPFFAVYISVSGWDWLMSIDVHWFSTMYSWYAFASFWVSGITVICFTVLYLRARGYLQGVTINHVHDLGKYMFAFTVFWTYLTYCQFMLIWYANIPEETIYFQNRYGAFKPLFYGIFIMNFVLPFLILMSRDAKRNPKFLLVAGSIILIGHFLDFYLMIMPAVVGVPVIGILEITLPCFFIGAMIMVINIRLQNAPLMVKNSPYLAESLHHEI